MIFNGGPIDAKVAKSGATALKESTQKGQSDPTP
jgi:hypothetical protein